MCPLQPKILAHTRACSASVLTCVDCSRDFDSRSVSAHVSCVTEHDKYAKGATKPGGYAAVGFYGEGGGEGGGNAGAASASAASPAGLHHLATRPPWTCALCKVTCTSRDVLVGHAAGAKHVRRARAAEKAAKRAGGGGDAATQARGAGEPAAADDAAPSAPSPAPAAAAAAAPPTPQKAGKKREGTRAPRWKKLATAALKAAPKRRLPEAALTAAVLAAAGVTEEGGAADAARAAWASSSRFAVRKGKVSLVEKA